MTQKKSNLPKLTKVSEKSEKKVVFYFIDYQSFTNKKITLRKKARFFRIFCHYIGMIKIEKEISILREVLVDSFLTGEERQSIHRQIAELEDKLKLERAIAHLGGLCKHIDEGKRPLPWGRSQTRL